MASNAGGSGDDHSNKSGDGRGKGKSKASDAAATSKSPSSVLSTQGLLSDLTQTLASASNGKLTPSTRLAGSAGAGLDTFLERKAGGSVGGIETTGSSTGNSFRTSIPSGSIAQVGKAQAADDAYASFGTVPSTSAAAELVTSNGSGPASSRVRPLPVSASDASGTYSSSHQLDGPLHAHVRASHGLASSVWTDTLADEFQQSISLASAAEADAAQQRIFESAWSGTDPTASAATASFSTLSYTAHPPPTDFLSALATEEAALGAVSQEPSSTNLSTLSSRPLRDPSSSTTTPSHPLDHALPHPPPILASLPYRPPSPSANGGDHMSHEQAMMHRTLALLQSSTQDPARVAERVVPPDPLVHGPIDSQQSEWEKQERLRQAGRDVYAPTPEMALRSVFGDGLDEIEIRTTGNALQSAASRLRQYLPQGSYIDVSSISFLFLLLLLTRLHPP